MKKVITNFLAIASIFAIASCGGSGNQKSGAKNLTEATLTLEATNFDVDYDLSEYVSIVDKEYTLKKDNETVSLEMTLELVKEDPAFKAVSEDKILLTDDFDVAIAVFITDGKDNDESNLAGLYMYTSDEQVQGIKKLLQGNIGDKLDIKFSQEEPEAQKILNNAKSIVPYRIASSIEMDTPEARRAKHPGYVLVENIKLPSQIKKQVEAVGNEDGYFPIYLDKYHYPSVDVTFRLLETVNTAPLASSYGQMWLHAVPLKANGANVVDIIPSYDEWRSDDSDGSQFKNFLESEPGETITLTFKGANNIDLFEEDQSKINAGIAKTTSACKEVVSLRFFIED
jgi:hypothetical protein